MPVSFIVIHTSCGYFDDSKNLIKYELYAAKRYFTIEEKGDLDFFCNEVVWDVQLLYHCSFECLESSLSTLHHGHFLLSFSILFALLSVCHPSTARTFHLILCLFLNHIITVWSAFCRQFPPACRPPLLHHGQSNCPTSVAENPSRPNQDQGTSPSSQLRG